MNHFKTGVLLVNLGTPNEPTRQSVYRYLKQFLLDKRVIDYSWLPRNLLVRLIIAPFRSRPSSKLYQMLWTENGSPLKDYAFKLGKGVEEILGSEFEIAIAMRYQNPSIQSAIDSLLDKKVSQLVVLPLFPQYASATTGSIMEEVMQILSKEQSIPTLRLINSFPVLDEMIEVIAERASAFELNAYDRFIFSFHGLPERQLKKADRHQYCLQARECCASINENNQFCYSAQCHQTARKIWEHLGLDPIKCTVSFQSRLGPEKWTQPYTSAVINEALDCSEKRILVFSPAFVADCLETLIEIGHEYKEEFLRKGGERLDLVPSLNDHPQWIRAIAGIIKANVSPMTGLK